MKLSKEEYKEAKDCLKRYNYNCINIINIKSDIMSISSTVIDGLPKAPYGISDKVFNSIVKIEENADLQNALKEYKAVVQALQLVNKDSKYIFEEMYIKSRNKWDIIRELNISEETYKRRHRNLIYTTYEELKKLTLN